MLNKFTGSVRTALLLALVTAVCIAVAIVGGGTSAQAASGQYTFANLNAAPEITCPAGQCFTDVDSSNGFYANVNALYIDGIIGGYTCGGPGEPCDAQNRPYYRPGNEVTRQQMAKFADLGRRNIADAVGLRLQLTNASNIPLIISTTTTDDIDSWTASSAEAIDTRCLRADTNCWAIYGSAQHGTRPAYFSGGTGVYITAPQASSPALDSNASATGSYGIDSLSSNYRSVRALNNNSSWYGLYVDTNGSNTGMYVNGNSYLNGDLAVTGTCTGCLSGSVIQNVDGSALQAGDVVTIVGSSPAVMGNSPVITVKKASTAYDTGVVGIVGDALYVPSAQVKVTYEAEQQAQKDARMAQVEGASRGEATGQKFDPSSITMPESTVTDAEGTVHADNSRTETVTNSYATVITLGSYAGVKVDASYGAIKAGDLLVSSPNAGYAMKATDKTLANGAVIGKALSGLDSGTGTISVLITLK